jgi:glycosyltransferase involved in cell wall biosynthesis
VSRGRIALLHYTAAPVVGGVETVIERHADLMADAGHDVLVVAGRGGSTERHRTFRRLALADTRHPRVREARQQLDAGSIPVGFEGLVEELTAELTDAIGDRDLVIAHNVASLHLNLALTAALDRMRGHPGGPKLVLWHHDVAAAMDAYRGELHDGWPWDLVRSPWPGTASIAISASRATLYARETGLDPGSIRVIPDGIDAAETLGLHATTRRFAADRRLTSAAPILLTPARLNPRKNIELAVEVVAALRRTMPSAALVITGAVDPHDPASRGYLERLRALAAERDVEDALHIASEWLDGPPPRRLVTDLYRVADALFLPSRDEGFGLPVLEAGIHRLPIFCTDIDALREVVGPGAVLFGLEDDADTIARSIATRLGADPAYLTAVRDRTTYDWRAIYAAAIAPLLESLLSAQPDG